MKWGGSSASESDEECIHTAKMLRVTHSVFMEGADPIFF